MLIRLSTRCRLQTSAPRVAASSSAPTCSRFNPVACARSSSLHSASLLSFPRSPFLSYGTQLAASFSSSSAAPALDSGRLTPSQIDFFNREGYLVLEGFTTPEETGRMKASAMRIIEEFAAQQQGPASIFSTVNQERQTDDYFLTSGDKIRCFYEEKAFDEKGKLKHDIRFSINKIGHALQEFDPVFRAFSNSPKVKACADALGYEKPAIVQGMYIFKQPIFGGVVSPHQDSTFLFTDPPSTLGVWLAIEDATLENGCLWAVPGSHKMGTKQRFVRHPSGNGTVFAPKEAEKLPTEPAVALPVRKGTVVLLHGSLVHFSHENKSSLSRHAYTVHIIETGKGTVYPSDNWLQRFDGKPFFALTGKY